MINDIEIYQFLEWLKTPEGLKKMKEAGTTGIVVNYSKFLDEPSS